MKKIKNIYKKITILILALALAVAYTKVTAFAEDNNPTEIEHNQTFSDSSINTGLGISRNYGLFSRYVEHYNDLECTIAAEKAKLSSNYNFSSNNLSIYKNRIIVNKTYTENGQAVANKEVKLRLYQIVDGENRLADEKTQTTDQNGQTQFIFDSIKGIENGKNYSIVDGTYQVKEVVYENGVEKEIIPDGSTFIDNDGNTIKVSSKNKGMIDLKSGFNNVSQFGQVVDGIINTPRDGSTVVLESQSDFDTQNKNAINQGLNNFKDIPNGMTFYNNRQTRIILAGTNGYSKIDWDGEFNRLSNLSVNLAKAVDTSDVKVYNYSSNYMTSNDIVNNGINFETEGKKWLVINIEVPKEQSEITMNSAGYRRDGKALDAEWITNQDTLGKQTNVIWNFYTVDNQEVQPYTGKVNFNQVCSGVFLVPDGEFFHNGTLGGTVIAKKYGHNNEIHQKRAIHVENAMDVENIVNHDEKVAYQSISGTKTLTGRNLQTGEFTFSLQKYTNEQFTNADGDAITTTNSQNGQFRFDLSYKSAGDYYYILKEIRGNNPGVTYDKKEYKVKISVKEENGKLVASDPQYLDSNDTEISFSNTYSANTSLNITGTKIVTNGLSLNKDDYTFKLQETDSQWKTKSDGYKEATKNLADGSFEFKALKYTQKDIGKTYYYVLSEDFSSKIDGVIYDQTKYHITVNVAYNPETKQLEATKEVKKGNDVVDNIEFLNSYSSSGEATIKGTKNLTGRKFSNTDQFDFDLYETGSDYVIQENQAPVKTTSITNVSNTKTKDFDFKLSYENLKYNEKQTHYYVVKEKNTGIDGITYDAKEYKVKVSVKDQNDGTASTEVKVENNKDIEFTNTFNYQGSTSISVDGTKTLSNKTLKANDFTFSLQEYKDENHKTKLGDAIETTNDRDGNIQYELKYNQNQLGNHYYILSEKSSSNDGIEYDSKKYYVTASVTYNEDEQRLEATKTITDEKGQESKVKFENKYSSNTSTVIQGTKKITGRTFKESDNFTFELYETNKDYKVTGSPLKTTTINKNDVGENESGFEFEVDYNDLKANESKTYYYIVKEKTPENNNLNGVTYDTTLYKVKVDVEDDGKGHATATQTLIDANNIEFTNTYEATGSSKLTLHKVLNGGTLKGNDFTFKVEQTDKNGKVLSNGKSGTAKNNASGVAIFNINFEEEGTYYFKVSEKNTNKSNITYDPIEYFVKIDVTDNGKGQLVAKQTVKDYENATMTPSDDEKNALTFKNSVGVQIVGHKSLENKKLQAQQFTFKLSKVDYNENTHKYTKVRDLMTSTNDESGNFNFAGFDTYNEEGTYYYLVEEVKGTDSTIEYDTTCYIVPIEVSQDDQGLVVEQGQMIQLAKDDVKNVDEIEFDNVYHCHGSVDITGKKELLDNDEIQVLDGGEFKFNIERVKNENGDVYTGNSVEKISRKQVSNDENGNFTFNIFYQNLDFTVKDQYTFYYKITEENSGRVIKGITYNADNREYIVKVDVTDNGDGTYTVVKSLVNGGEISFENTVNASGETSIIGHKSLTGKDLEENEFAFTLQETDEQYNVVENGYHKTVKNDVQGQFEFNITGLKKAGNYYYKVTEKDESSKSGITFDKTVYYVKVAAKYDKDDRSKLITTNTYYDENHQKVDEITFINEFKAKGSTTLKGKKTFVDEDNDAVDFDAGDFEFKLEELTSDGFVKENGVQETVKNDTNKEFEFKLDYTKPGTYYYRVTEVKDNDNHDVAYDETVYHVIVQVKADDTDKLKVSKTITYTDDLGNQKEDRSSLDFTNTLYQYQLATMSLEGNKVVSGSQAVAMEPGLFRFELVDQNNTKKIDTAKNDELGVYSFDDIEFTKPGNYNYTVKEINAGNEIAGIAYSNQELNIATKVSKDSQGNLVIDYTNVTDENGNQVDNAINITSSQLVNQSTKDIHVRKVWDDVGHEDQRQNVTVDLLRNGKKVEGQSIILSNDSNWQGVFTDLPIKDQNGNAYVYSVSEENSVGYQVEYSQESNNSYVITNKYIDVTSADVQLEAHKDLVGGKTLTAGMYQFDLISNDEVIDSQVNDDSGNIHFNTLSFDQEGTYTYQVKEHISDNDPHIEYDQSVYQVTVDVKRQDNRLVPTVTYTLDGKDVSNITFTNIYHPLTITVQKRSKDLSQDPLEGAVYGLYRVNDKGKDILVEKQTSNSEGYMTFSNAVHGYKYYFKEISAPNGHTVDEYKTKTFEVSYQRSKSGKVSYQLIYDDDNTEKTTKLIQEENQLISQKAVALMESDDYTVNLEAVGVADEVTKLIVSKLDQNGNYLKGAHLQIVEKDTNKVVCDWISTDSSFASLRKLNVNTVYVLKEIEAPEGYKRAQDTEFKLDDYGIVTKISGDAKLVDDQTFNLYNTKETVQKVVYKENRTTVTTNTIRNVFVKTGDNTNIMMYVVIMIVSVGIVLILYRKNKKD